MTREQITVKTIDEKLAAYILLLEAEVKRCQELRRKGDEVGLRTTDGKNPMDGIILIYQNEILSLKAIQIFLVGKKLVPERHVGDQGAGQ